jgi:hypothetical protein
MATLTHRQKLEAKKLANSKLQTEVNDISPTDKIHGWAERMIRVIAYSAHAECPQYDYHWAGWRLVRVKQQVTTKGGLAFADGDFALMNPSVNKDQQRDGFRTVYSIRNGVDTSVNQADLDLLS